MNSPSTLTNAAEPVTLGRFSPAEASFILDLAVRPTRARSETEQLIDQVVASGLVARGLLTPLRRGEESTAATWQPSGHLARIVDILREASNVVVIVGGDPSTPVRLSYCGDSVALDQQTDVTDGSVQLQQWQPEALRQDWAERAGGTSAPEAREWEGAELTTWAGPLRTLTDASFVTTTLASTRDGGDAPTIVVCDDGHSQCWLALATIDAAANVVCQAERIDRSDLSRRFADLLLIGPS